MESKVLGGWLDLGEMYLCESVGLVYRSVCILLSVICVRVSKKGTDWEGVETVNFTRGWQELRYGSSGTYYMGVIISQNRDDVVHVSPEPYGGDGEVWGNLIFP